MTFQRFDRILAIYTPQRLDDLKPGVREFIGHMSIWTADWIIEEGDYAGQWALHPEIVMGPRPVPLAWAPQCDLTLVTGYTFEQVIRHAIRDKRVAAGWKLAPIEPTKEMIVAGQDAHDLCVDEGSSSNADGERFDYTIISPDAPYHVYKAMLGAVPLDHSGGVR